MYATVKTIHLLLAAVSISGFVLRGLWMMAESPRLQARWVRIAPHVVDTLLLGSGVAMALEIARQPLAPLAGWLTPKLIAIVVYILLGAVALRRGRTRRARVLAFGAALMVFAYVIGVALTRSPWLGIA